MRVRITDRTPYEELPAMLSLQEVAIWLNRNYTALHLAVKRGKAPFSARKIGQSYTVSKTQLAEKPITQIFKR